MATEGWRLGRLRRARRAGVLAAGTVLLFVLASPTAARVPKGEVLSADLDGKPIELVEVGQWYCHDFEYPVIHCFSSPEVLEESTESALAARTDSALASGDLTLAAAGVTYLTVYEFTTYQGAFMHMNENYSLLSLIGWNDRISSFKVRNLQSGAFWTDWLYSGTRFNFCCNQELTTIGGFNDTFSSVFRN